MRKRRDRDGCVAVGARLLPVVLAAMVATGCEREPRASKHTIVASDPPARPAVPAPAKPLSPNAVTSDWPRFLGPTHDGKSPETKLIQEFPPDGPPLVWQMETGSGYACPAVAGGKLVYFHRVGGEEVVVCRDAETGESLWSFEYSSRYVDRYGFNNGPRSGPVIDGERVYTIGAEGKLHCLSMQSGEGIWRHDLAARYDMRPGFFGYGSAPLVECDLLIVVVGAPGGPCVVAFDKRTGEEVWRAADEWGADYASPIPAIVHGQRRVFVFAGGERKPPVGGLLGLDPADGSIYCRVPFRSSKYEAVNAASPAIVDDAVFISSSYGTGGALVDMLPGGGCELAWKTDSLRCHFATPIYHGGYLYGFDGMGKSDTALVCVDFKTGRQVWRAQPSWTETLVTSRGPQEVELGIYRGSLIQVDGRFLCLGETGDLHWLNLSAEGYRELSRARLFYANESWTPPVLSRGLLYVTQNAKDTLTGRGPRLLCYDLRG